MAAIEDKRVSPFRTVRVRRACAAAAAAIGSIALALGGFAPAHAEAPPPSAAPTTASASAEPSDPPTTPQPTDPPTPPPAEPTTPPPGDPTTPPPTEPTTPPPTDPATPPPTDPGTPPPTDPTTPPPTDPATPPPTDPETPPSSPSPTEAPAATHVVVGGNGPVLRLSSALSPEVTSLLAARATVDRATKDLRTAESSYASARATQDSARATAKRLDLAAAIARSKAAEAARASMASTRGQEAAYASMGAALEPGQDLLAGLAGVQRVAQLGGDSAALLEISTELDARADEAESRAAAAWEAVDAVPVVDRQDEVASAETVLAGAKSDLSGLQSKVSASNVAFIDSLPVDGGQLSEQGWTAPVRGRITDGFGPRPNKPLPGVNEFHRGTDVAAACMTAVVAATAGTVIEAGPDGGYGNWILIDHGSGISTGYAHLSDGGILVTPGQYVEAGELIGAVGSTGESTGCHLHFEVRVGGVAIDSVPFLAARGITYG